MVMVSISALEWVIIGLGLLVIALYIVYAVYRKKHQKQKKDDDDE